MTEQKTLSDLAREALAIQDASNLTAVLRSAHEAAKQLFRHPDSDGTHWVNTHPVMVLYSDKIAHLTNTQTLDNPTIDRAYQYCLEQRNETQER